jgi:hypothetical protein
MGIPVLSASPGTRRPFKLRVRYEPTDIDVLAVEGKIQYGGQEVEVSSALAFQKLADGQLEVEGLLADPIILIPAFSNQFAVLSIALQVVVDGSPFETPGVPMRFGTGKDVFMPIFETRNLAVLGPERRYGLTREDASGGDGWGRVDTLAWLHPSDLRFNDLSGEHAWQVGGKSLGSHTEHKGGYDIDARYVDDNGQSLNSLRGDENGADILAVLMAAQDEVSSNAADKPNLERIVNWIQRNRTWLNGIAEDEEVVRLYVGILGWHRNALSRGQFPDGTPIPTVNGVPAFVGEWTDRNSIITPMTGNHEGHIHVRIEP